jgi:proprotein convertase subtilisin/kexin type 5
VVTNPGSLPMLTIRNIISPSLSPSTSISLSTYSSLGHLIDQNSIMVWTIACQLPCRTCQPLNTSACLSCYSNLSLVTNEIYYFGGNHSCVSDCGLLYYKNTSTNACEACSALCGNCYNYSFCTSCPANQYLLLSNSTCYSLCPRGYFAQATQCIACTAGLTCYACSDELTCSSCMGKFYYQLQCLPNCPIGITTPNTTLWICQACPVNCSYCVLSNSSVVCTSCSSGLLDSGRCVNWC